jgi:GT2 family glycosyltransferase
MNTHKLRTLPYLVVLLPLDLIVAVGLTLVDLVSIPLRWLPRPARSSTSPKRQATIQILNWDGRHLLEQCLPAVLEAVRMTGAGHQILVVDNGSTDGSVAFIRAHFPEVRVIELDRNYGFTGGNNRGVAAIDTDIVVLLNNDMVVDPGFLGPLLDGFTDPSVCAVASQVFFADRTRRREETGKTRCRFDRGFVYLWHDEIRTEDDEPMLMPVFWAGGGSCAFDRRKYLEIGGLDPLYHPFYVEDTDLSYQAWKRGWKCLLAPASRVVHKHRATSGRKFGHEFVDETIRKNMYLFIWKNITDPSMVLQHILNLSRNHARGIMTSGASFEMRAFARAVWQLHSALWKRLKHLRSYRSSDQDVFMRSQR